MCHTRTSVALIVALAAVGACGGPADPPIAPAEAPRAVASPRIVNGTAGAAYAGNAVDFPGVNCSATALDEEWVLTAKHCTINGTFSNNVFTASGSEILVAGSSTAHRVQPDETRVIREIHRHPTEDVALLRVHPFSTVTPHMAPWGADASYLANKILSCSGQGDNTLPLSGAGVWRSASMVVSSWESDGYYLTPNGSGQVPWIGDSGGSCVFAAAAGVYVTGVQSTVHWQCQNLPAGASCNNNANATSVDWARQVTMTAAVAGWIDDLRQRAPLFLYDRASGTGYVSMLERSGAYTSVGVVHGFSSNWTHVVVLHDDALFFYDSASGTAATATLDKDGRYAGGAAVGNVGAGFTQVVAVGRDGLVLARPMMRSPLTGGYVGYAMTARVDSHGAFSSGETFNLFPASFTHLAATRSGSLLAYSATGGTASTGTVDDSLHYTAVGSVTGFSPWTHVTGVNDYDLFFYDAATGKAYLAQLDPGGHYHSYGALSGFGRFTSIAGASNGGLFLLDNVGHVAAISRVLYPGLYSYVGSVSGFSPWTNVAAD